MNKKGFILAFLFASVMALLIACSDNSNTDEPGNDNDSNNDGEQAEQVLKIANDQEPAGLDPHKTPAHSSVRIYSQVYSGLVQFDADMNVVGDLAVDWDQPDDQTYVFNLREGVKFHNDREMTAEDVKYSFERILDEETASHIASYFSNVDSIEVLGDYQIQFNLKSADATFLSNLTNASAAVVAKEVVEENGDLQQVAVGTGPFVFEEWVPDNRVVLLKNENYYDENLPKLDQVIYYTMKDEAARMSAIRTGEVDLTTVSAQSADLIKDQEGLEVKDYQSLEYSYVGFNNEHEILSNEKVRQALSLATNRESVADIVWGGDAVVSGPVAPSMGDWAIDVTEHELYSNNLEKAKELLAEAGYENGFDITITTASTYADMVDTAQILQQQWAEIGVNAEIKQIEWGEYIDTWVNKTADILVGRNGSGTDPDRALNYFFHTEGSANVWNFSNADYDELVTKGKTTVDLAERKAIYDQAQNDLLTLSPNLFLVSPMKYVAVRDSVEGFTPYPHDGEYILEVTKK
ncbi:peptide/nickel transport system substrate-binding protein [Salirhabdus euzebyi]|uniref:Peptide/nickel transport system substrate-binding protein n=1 Tax=Salirhabdus euzebyi TaxID=394506 RepID=A0A841Q2W3_9BACI|nr:ABC transporter substrate-binding protein [Salirhabdus euzebyi]MBB6451708.1 peptide/nickel transport system substrate-binding protein [Salirhabdus euzebyi]